MQEIPKLTTESNEIKKEKKKKRYINYINFKTTLKKKKQTERVMETRFLQTQGSRN